MLAEKPFAKRCAANSVCPQSTIFSLLFTSNFKEGNMADKDKGGQGGRSGPGSGGGGSQGGSQGGNKGGGQGGGGSQGGGGGRGGSGGGNR
jgi:hypothetical protein